MLAALHAPAVLLAGINFNITIRGVAVVAVAVSVLMGSVWLILSTNVGSRVGTLLAFSSFFGWLTIMGTVWWIFGIGWKGADPSWKTVDINRGDLTVSALDKARDLPNKPLAQGTPYDLVKASGSEAAIKDYASDIPADRLTQVPANATPEQVKIIAEENAKKAADWQLKNQTVTLAEVAAVDRSVITTAVEAGKINFGGWRLLSTAQSGEAVASATASLVSNQIFDSADKFKVLDSYDVGGKPKLPANPNRWDRMWHYIKNSAHVTHPTRYAVVQVQGVKAQEAVAGEAPPRPVVDPNAQLISVIMERNLGNKRFKPAMVTVGSLLLFAVSATMLHSRDKQAMANRAAAKKK